MGVIRCPHCQEMIPDDFEHCGFCGKDVNVKNEKYMLQIGTVLQDRYYIGAAIGQGGFGITYSCCDLRLDMKVAIKEYYPDRLVHRDTSRSDDVDIINPSKGSVYDHEKNKCLLEARTLGDFADDPGVVRVSDIFNQNNTVYIVMEYLEGMTLEQFRTLNPEVDFDFCYKMLHPIIKVLERIHERGLIHRDISPSNIMVLPDGRAKLLDFGSASRLDQGEDKDEILVLRQGYSPIEQYQKDIALGPWTDVYAFCATFYYMLTGINPVSADTRKGGDTLQKPSKLGAVILGGQEDALMHGLTINPELRTRSMKQLAEEMELRVPVIKPEQFINLKDHIESNMMEGISEISDAAGDGKSQGNADKKVGRKKKVIRCALAACAVLIIGTVVLGKAGFFQKVSTPYLVEVADNNLKESDNVKLTIKTSVDYKLAGLRYEYTNIYENEETVEVWPDQGGSIYAKNTSTVNTGYIAYMVLDHVKGDKYRLGRHESGTYEVDNAYDAFIIPMLLNASCLSSDMELSKELSKIGGKSYYTVSGELSTKNTLYMLEELDVLSGIPSDYVKSYGLIPKSSITAYFDSESYKLKRISITMTDFDKDALSRIYTSYAGNDHYIFDKLSVTMNIDYTYNEEAKISEAEAKRFEDTKAKMDSGKDITWAYKWGYIWSLNVFE